MSRETDDVRLCAPRGTRARPVPTATALGVLRARTTEAHHGLDARLAGPAGRVTDEASYARLLTVLATLHARTERPLRDWVARTPWVRESLGETVLPARAEAYAADLAALGAPVPAVTPDPAYDDATGLAALYLLAGSSKGGRVLLHGLPDHVGPAARRGLTAAASPASARLWRGVLHTLDEPVERAHPGAHLELAGAASRAAVTLFEELSDLAADDRAPDRTAVGVR